MSHPNVDDAPAVLCPNEDCELFDLTQDGDREAGVVRYWIRCEECGEILREGLL